MTFPPQPPMGCGREDITVSPVLRLPGEAPFLSGRSWRPTTWELRRAQRKEGHWVQWESVGVGWAESEAVRDGHWKREGAITARRQVAAVHGGLTCPTLVPTPSACVHRRGQRPSRPPGTRVGSRSQSSGRVMRVTGQGSVRPGPRGPPQAGGPRPWPTCSSFIAVGKAGVSITSEASRFSKTAAAGEAVTLSGRVTSSDGPEAPVPREPSVPGDSHRTQAVTECDRLLPALRGRGGPEVKGASGEMWACWEGGGSAWGGGSAGVSIKGDDHAAPSAPGIHGNLRSPTRSARTQPEAGPSPAAPPDPPP